MKEGDGWVKEIIEGLTALPNEIYDMKRRIRDKRVEQQAVKLEMELMETEVFSDVSAENNSAGKPVYSNEQARKGETLLRLHRDKAYKAMYAREANISAEAEVMQFELERLQDHYRSLRYIARITAAELEAMSRDEEVADEQSAEQQF